MYLRQNKPFHIGMACVLFLGVPFANAQSSKTPPVKRQVPAKPEQPIQAVLTTPLDLTHVHAGSAFAVRVDAGWSGPTCSLRPGSLIRGHVTALTKRSKTEKNSSLQLGFDGADCQHNMEAAPHFALIAMVGPLASQHHNGQDGVSEGPPLSNDLPLEMGGGIRNANLASALTDNYNLPARNLPAQILPGQVIDVDRTNLEPGAGPEGASTIVATRKDVRLEAGTTLVLIPAEVESARLHPSSGLVARAADSSAGVGGGGSSMAPDPRSKVAVSSPPPPPPEPPDVTAVCAGTCNVEVHGQHDALTPAHAQASLDLSALGYVPASGNRELAHFSQDTDVVYLGANRLLCSFDPKQLRLRTEFDGESSRNIRAVLVDATTLRVQRVVDWRIRGEGQYLWQLASGHLLVHLGRELKELDTELNPVRSIHLDGRVAWVVSSPSGDHLAVGTLHERYSLAYRNELARELPDEPTQDVQVRVYDRDFHELMTVVRGLHTPPPVLSDSGELRVEAEPHNRWRITEIDWRREQHLLAISRSDCRPVLSSPEHGLIFMLGCTATGGRWYRMLRSDGHPVLKGESPSAELEQSARASAGNTFAVRTVLANKPLMIGQPFRPADLKLERISVYNSETGAHIASLVSEDFAPSEQSFALSPSGDQMAIIGRNSLSVYPFRR